MKQQSYETEHGAEAAYTGNLSMILSAKTTSQKKTKRRLNRQIGDGNICSVRS